MGICKPCLGTTALAVQILATVNGGWWLMRIGSGSAWLTVAPSHGSWLSAGEGVRRSWRLQVDGFGSSLLNSGFGVLNSDFMDCCVKWFGVGGGGWKWIDCGSAGATGG